MGPSPLWKGRHKRLSVPLGCDLTMTGKIMLNSPPYHVDIAPTRISYGIWHVTTVPSQTHDYLYACID